MQTVVADVSVRSRENPRVYRGLQHRRPQRVSEIEVQRFQHMCRNGQRTDDNQTEEIQLSRRTTYRTHECEAVEMGDQLEHGAESICSYGSCPHEGDGGQSQG